MTYIPGIQSRDVYSGDTFKGYNQGTYIPGIHSRDTINDVYSGDTFKGYNQ